MLCLDVVGAAKGQPCGAPRRVRRQAAGLVGVLKQREVCVDLTREIVVRPPDARAGATGVRQSGAWRRLLALVEQQLD